ncbi:MAG: helix-turn-helix domain-containing protein [Acidobacteria bacterium]|nr:helix-turn-helix domain-containing protein [Acidobacteriota bacterium]
MRTLKLPNYLRSYRKRLGFTQDELAFLLCLHSGSKVCRYEQYRQHPSLKTALAYQVVFRASAEELFAGMFQAIQSKSQKRADLLLKRLQRRKGDPLTARKLDILNTIRSS